MSCSQMMRWPLAVAAVVSLSACVDRQAKVVEPTLPPMQYQLSKTLPIGGEGRWDFLAYDGDAKLVWVTRQTHTQLIDPATGAVAVDIAGTDGAHGIAIVPSAGRAFITAGKTNDVVVVDLKTRATIGRVPAGQNPDAIAYDPASNRVYCMNAKSNDATIIDPAADPAKAAVGNVKFESNPESAVADGLGHLYVNLEDGDSIAAVDTRAMSVTGTWKIDGGEGPTGLAIDPFHHILYSGCHNKVMACVDSNTGKTLATLPIGEGVDACTFDPSTGEAFASCHNGTITGVHQTGEGQFAIVQTIATKPGARTVTIDPMTHNLYLPTAEFEPLAAGEKRPQMKAGTFMILVVSPTK